MDNAAIRKTAQKILSEPDFQQYREKADLGSLWRWLRQFFDFKLPAELHGDPLVWQVVGWLFKVLLVVLLLVAITYVGHGFYQKINRRTQNRWQTHEVSQAQREEAQAMYVRLAAEALSKQDYRLAMHYLFLAAVSQVIRDALFHGTEFMTNREIAQATDFSRFGEQSSQINQLFQEMLAYDEPRWFGNPAISVEEYNHFKGFYHQFIAALSLRMEQKRYA